MANRDENGRFVKGNTEGRKLDSEYARELGKKSGEAKRAAKRRKKTMAELASFMLDAPATNDSAKKMAASFGIDPEEVTNGGAVVAGLIVAAMKGNVSAAQTLISMEAAQDSASNGDFDELTKSLRELADKL